MMFRDLFSRRVHGVLRVAAVTLLALPWSTAQAANPVHQSRAADAQGRVEIVNVAGTIEVVGWDKPEVDVDGSVGNDVERVDLSGEAGRTLVQVVLRSGSNWGASGEAHLTVRVPAKSPVVANLVSSDLKVSALQGELQVQTVSGDVRGEVGGDVHANAVSGDIQLTAHAAKSLEIKTVSGDITAAGGDGQSEFSTVSGNVKVQLGAQDRAKFKSVSGDVSATLRMGPSAQIEVESVSGDIGLQFAGPATADFDVRTVSGDIINCFGPKPVVATHGSGARLEFTNGAGGARVRISAKSGDVRLCDKAGGR
jgi:Putative adhesin